MRFTCLLLFSFLALAAASERPFRLGSIVLDKTTDQVKPLAVSDTSGWVVNSGVLIGAFDRQWVGGISLKTREVLWWMKADTPLVSPVTSVGNWVMLGFADGTVKKVEASTGKSLWSTTLDSYTPRNMLLTGATLVVFTSGQQLYALDFQTGVTKWLYDAGFPDGMFLQGQAAPVLDENRILVGTSSGEIQAVNLISGQLLWRYDPEFTDARFHDVVGDMIVRGRRLLISRYDGIVASVELSGAARQNVWLEKLPSVTTSTYRGGRYYVGCVNGDVYALDPGTGKKIWRFNTGQAVSTLTAGEDTLFVGGSNGRITAIELVEGKQLWHDDVGGILAAKPFLYAGGLFYGTGLKVLYGYKVH